MKIHRIELENLNSLYGRFEIDLEHEFGGSSLFLIHGPTGSGKSTIMDAVSLALFGQTPRFDSKRGDAAADPRTVMSRGAGTCFAQVEFSKLTSAGRRRYRATWSARRAHKSPTGNLQEADRCIEERAADGAWQTLVSSSKAKVFSPRFAEVLENFEVVDFQRSMLLAQGQFDAFLSADDAERAKILERLTDTGTYQALGGRAARMQSAYRALIQRYRSAAEAGVVVSEKEVMRLQGVVEEARAELQRREATRLSWEFALAWRRTSQQLQNDLDTLVNEQSVHDEQCRSHQLAFDRLATHERCDAEGAFACADLLQELVARVVALDSERTETTQMSCGQAETVQELEPEFWRADGRLARLEQALRALDPPGVRLTQLNVERADLARSLQSSLAEVNEREDALRIGKAELQRLQEQADTRAAAAREAENAWSALTAGAALLRDFDALSEELESAIHDDGLVREHQSQVAERRQTLDEGLRAADRGLFETERTHTEALTTLRARLGALEREVNVYCPAASLDAYLGQQRDRELMLVEALQLAKSWEDACRRHLQAHERWLSHEQTIQTRVVEVAEGNEGVQLASRAAEKATLEVRDARERFERAQRLASWLPLRAELTPGEPCPLCGAQEHPYAEGHDNDDVARDLQSALADAERMYEEAVEQDGAVHRRLRDQEAQLHQREGLLEAARLRGEELQEEQRRLSEEETGARSALLQVDASWGGDDPASLILRIDADLVDLRSKCRRVVDLQQRWSVSLDELQQVTQQFELERSTWQARQRAGHEELARLEEEQARLAARAARRDERQKALGARLAAYEEAERPFPKERGAEQWRDWLKALRDDAVARQAHREQAKRAYGDAMAEVRRLETLLDERSATLARRSAETSAMRERHDEVCQQQEAERVRFAAIAGQHEVKLCPDKDDWSHDETAANAERDVQTERVRRGELEAALSTARTAHAALVAKLNVLTAQQDEWLMKKANTEQQLQEVCHRLGLGSVQELFALRLPDEQVADLGALRRSLAERTAALQVKRKEREQRRADHEANRPSSLTEDVTTEIIELAREDALQREQAARDALDRSRDEWVTARDRLLRQQDLAQKSQEAERRGEVWAHLHEYIGKNQGQQFLTFVQALHLQQLLEFANQHLLRLAPRYQLRVIESDGMPSLLFDVEDLWQAGERVSLRALSGGERFLVSLSMALGLSDFRQVKMPIETLLLDEGFGTLDADTLDVALGALGQLQGDGRQVGIISHVAGLPERIPAQVRVMALGGGRSKLQVVSVSRGP